MSWQQRLKKYMNSAEIKQAMRDWYGSALANGETVGDLSLDNYKEIANDLEEYIKRYIRGMSTIRDAASKESLINSYNASVTCEYNQKTSKITINITLDTSALERPSLNPKSGGVYNIYGLISKGYEISSGKRTPFGIWHGDWTLARRRRAADPFLANAVAAWYSENATKYNLKGYKVSSIYS